MAYITKPIALDETLQNVVTAIQGITQGGMIVSTGNVGSSTQPVYINGGVPTAGMNFAITTGTATSANNNISLDRTEVYKSGNVVQVNVRAIVNTAFTPSENTLLVKLPYKPKASWPQISRVSGTMDGSNSAGMCEISNTGQIIWGSAPYSQLAANTKIWFSGTYLTED
jgi:hypothetical protein